MPIKKKRKLPVKKLIPFAAVIIVLALIISSIVVTPAKKTASSALLVFRSAKEVSYLIRNQDIINSSEKLKETKIYMQATKKDLNALAWTKAIPFFGNYYRDAEHLINIALHGIDIGDIMIEAIKPHADLLGLEGEDSFVMGSAEDRIEKIVEIMDKITPEIDKVEEKLRLIKKEADQVDPKHYPEVIFGKKVYSQITLLKNLVDRSYFALSEGKPLIKNLPRVLGKPEHKKYLVLFQNDKQLRSTGGFITAYAIFRLEDGKIYMESSDDIYKLDKTKIRSFIAPEPISKYLSLPYWNLRDTNISPDYNVSMKNFEQLYRYVRRRADIDGIVAVDTHAILKIMEVLGPIDLGNARFTTKLDPRCNCPHVIFELEDYSNRLAKNTRKNKEDLFGTLMNTIIQKSLGSSPRLYWGKLFQTLTEELNQKHILVYLHEENAQKEIDAFNYGGKIRDFDEDYLHINDTNFAEAKSNMYVRQEVEQRYERNKDGSIIKTITIKYANPQPPSDCDLKKNELCLNGLLRNWLRVYVPKGSELIGFKGSEVKVSSYEDLGKTVFDGFFTIQPQESAQIIIKYKLPFTTKKKETLNLLIQKQPGTEGPKYTIPGNNKDSEFNLTTDKEVKIQF